MGYMFWRCAFNQPIGTWNVGNVTNFDYMFWQNPFNQNIGAWNVEKATSMSEMFGYSSFNNSGSSDINNWRPISCSNFSLLFRDSSFNQPVGNWPISASNINMQYMFLSTTAFNQNLGLWDVSKVTNMTGLFQSATTFNNSGSNAINNWRPISCSNFSSMFYNATAFNQPVANWPLSASSINMSNMFGGDSSGVSCKFNQPLNTWDTSRVTNMSGMFFRNTAFNQDLGAWNTSNVTNTSYMFYGCTAFNNSGSSTIGNWNTANITSFNGMFEATPFNQNIGSWDVSKATDLGSMFNGSSFNNGGNPSIGNWIINTSSAVSMTGMFRNNGPFNQDIGNWNVSRVNNFSSFMSGRTVYSYLHSIYNGWINNKLQPNLTIDFSTIKYSGSAAEGRALLSRTYNTASITGYSNDGGFMAITCSVNHNVIVGNKIFMSGSSFAGINGVQTVAVVGSPTTLTLNTIYDPTATGGTAITGYGWSITDGGVV
jgi:surface protein